MFRLTIYQKKITKYMAEGQEKSLETEDATVFEGESMEALLLVIATLSACDTETDTRFLILKSTSPIQTMLVLLPV